MGWNQNAEEGASFTFVKKEDGADASNMASKFAKGAMRSEISLADGQLAADFESVIKGEAIYLPEFHCGKTDFALLAGLAKDMETHELASEGGGMVNWSKHLKHENPEFSQTFARIVHAMSEYFDVEVYATRLNFYRDGTDWKPFHHDSHAFGGREKREDFTMGASFGGERELTFLHEPSGTQFSFPQRNGDVFAFTTQVNKRFKHGVPKLTRGIGGPRFSIIAWGRRRELNSRNGGAASSAGGGVQELKLPTPREAGGYSAMTGAGGGGASGSSFASGHAASAGAGGEKPNELVMGSGECSELIRRFIREEDGRSRARRGVGGGRGGSGSASGRASGSTKSAAILPPSAKAPVTPTVMKMRETRGSAPGAAALRSSLGDERYTELKDFARRYQRGEVDADAFYEHAKYLCDGDAGKVMALVAHLPNDETRRAELLAAHAARLAM